MSSTTLTLNREGYPKVEFTNIKCKNDLELVLITTNNPIYSTYVTIPTFINDDKGLPHTLEHLIFCGSANHPEKGYLDRLATLCQSNGTNAYTSDDHTCYTFSTCSLRGLLQMLPVYLDHIFRPTLNAKVCLTEVFHKDNTGAGKGVVYCEMGGREWSESDQTDRALRSLIFDGDKELDVYRWECGGRTKCLCELTLEEIQEYHSRFYRPGNAVVILCGDQNLKNQISEVMDILESVQFNPMSTHHPSPLDPVDSMTNGTEKSVKLEFPSNDETLGSVAFAWRGPPSNDIYQITALHVLMRILQDTSASPLQQHFVELSEPIASDIDYDIKAFYQTIIAIYFSGVPTKSTSYQDPNGDEEDCLFLEEGVLKARLLNFIKLWSTDRISVQERVQVAIKSLKIKMQETLEDEPHDVCASYTMPQIVRSHWPFSQENATANDYGSSLLDIPECLERLSREPLEFWIELLGKFILGTNPVEVRMFPSAIMSEKIKALEVEQLRDIPVSENISPPKNFSSKIPLVEIDLPNKIDCRLSYPRPEVQIVDVPETLVKRLILALDISTCVPPHLWPYLPLFQELIFQADVNVTEEILTKYSVPESILGIGLIPYQELVEKLSTVFSTFEAAVGLGNEIFSVGYLDSHLVLSICGRVPYELEELKGVALAILEGTVFSVERVEEILENLISQLKDNWGSAETVLDSRLTEVLKSSHILNYESCKRLKTYHRNSPPVIVEDSLGLVSQSLALQQAKNLLSHDPDALIGMLEHIRRELLVAKQIVNFGGPLDGEAEMGVRGAPLFNLPLHGILDGIPINTEGTFEIIPIQDITSTYLNIAIPLNIYPTFSEDSPEGLFCIALLCQLLSYTEGPLFSKIRGMGLAYHASISVQVWHGLLQFHLGDSIDPISALNIFYDVINETLREAVEILENSTGRAPQILSEETLKTAKAVQMFQFVSERATPSAIVSTAMRCNLRGLPLVGSLEEREWNERMLAIQLDRLAFWAKEILPRFLDPLKSIRVATVPEAKLEDIMDDMKKVGFNPVVNDLVKKYKIND